MRRLSGLLVLIISLLVVLPAVAEEKLGVVDFCTLRPAQNTGKFQKQRVMMFAPSGTEKIEAGEAVLNEKGEKVGTKHELKAAGGARHYSEVFMMTFPLKRFHNVVVPASAPPQWSQKKNLSKSEIQAAVKGIQPYGAFLAYSLDCTDYLVLPEVTDFSAEWRQVKVKKKVNGKDVEVTMWQLTTKPMLKVSVYKFDAMTNSFALLGVGEGASGGLFDFITDLGSMILGQAGEGQAMLTGAASKYLAPVEKFTQKLKMLKTMANDLNGQIQNAAKLIGHGGATIEALSGLDLSTFTGPAASAAQELDALLARFNAIADSIIAIEAVISGATKAVTDSQDWAHQMAIAANMGWSALISGLPGSDCTIPASGRDGVAGLPKCSGNSGLPTRQVGVAGMSERSSPVCKEISEKSSLPEIATCEIRVRGENTTLLAQKECRSIDGWKLFAPLCLAGDTAEDPGISLGNDEGVKRGDVFRAVKISASGKDDLGFAKVVALGPGGKAGDADPTTLKWRAGDAKPGTRMEEHPQIGVAATVTGGAVLGLATNEDNIGDLGMLPGAGITVGYSMSPYIGLFDEIWLRAHFDGLLGSTDLFPGINGVPEEHSLMLLNFLAGPEAVVYIARRLELFVAVMGGYSMVSLTRKDAEDEEKGWSGGSASLLGEAGFNIILHPDWQIRVGALYRFNVSDIAVTSEDAEGVERKVGSMSAFHAGAGLTYIF